MGKDERLKSRKLIERIFRQGRSFALFPFRVYYAPLSELLPAPLRSQGLPVPGPIPPPEALLPVVAPSPVTRLQAGFGASSRNFKKAVDRNRIKRLIREAYRLQKHPLCEWLKEKDRTLAVFFIYTEKELPDYGLVKDKIGLALQKLMKEPGS